METTDPIATAMHESGHAVAALSVGVDWTSATIDPSEGGLAGCVRFPIRGRFLDPLSQAFVFYAGSAAEARYLGCSVGHIMKGSGAHDLPFFEKRLAMPGQRNMWDSTLLALWPTIEYSAVGLLVAGTLRPEDPDPLQDSVRVERFIQRVREAQR